MTSLACACDDGDRDEDEDDEGEDDDEAPGLDASTARGGKSTDGSEARGVGLKSRESRSCKGIVEDEEDDEPLAAIIDASAVAS